MKRSFSHGHLTTSAQEAFPPFCFIDVSLDFSYGACPGA
jgi:hypothetical protein